ncbi:MAG TPA: bifunctional glutamate N-acetyltransferase/amino-acid acetyltransferase ArgJ [Actinomycetota bacterium]|nr:bifunctional glutamate N-acetyltransferase/amino-acid acetyltransferase ArgJ [Actinomycetota bacterium]
MTALPQGFSAAGVAAGLKLSGSADLGILLTDRPAAVAGVFTTNRYAAPPVLVTKRHVRRGSARAIVVNSGNANACTGEQGLRDARAMARIGARHLSVKTHEVLVASTGVIGQVLDMGAVEAGIAKAAPNLSISGAADFARCIMTTDTRPKTAAAEVGGARIVGFAKGAGMMAPEMATMLAFVATDAPVPSVVLQEALRGAVMPSFNMLNLDACMSTNDTVLVLANGAVGGSEIEPDSTRARAFADALADVCSSLARQIADDGEGMTKLVSIVIRGARNEVEARRAGHAIANSVLLRCALNGSDPYWGRVLAALGAAPIAFDPNKIDVWMGGEQLCARGTFGPGDVAKARAALQQRNVEIVVDMHRGDATGTVLTNDLSVEYVKFNTEYTT